MILSFSDCSVDISWNPHFSPSSGLFVLLLLARLLQQVRRPRQMEKQKTWGPKSFKLHVQCGSLGRHFLLDILAATMFSRYFREVITLGSLR